VTQNQIKCVAIPCLPVTKREVNLTKISQTASIAKRRYTSTPLPLVANQRRAGNRLSIAKASVISNVAYTVA